MAKDNASTVNRSIEDWHRGAQPGTTDWVILNTGEKLTAGGSGGNVQAEKTKIFNYPETSDIEPDSGYDSMKKVKVQMDMYLYAWKCNATGAFIFTLKPTFTNGEPVFMPLGQEILVYNDCEKSGSDINVDPGNPAPENLYGVDPTHNIPLHL